MALLLPEAHHPLSSLPKAHFASLAHLPLVVGVFLDTFFAVFSTLPHTFPLCVCARAHTSNTLSLCVSVHVRMPLLAVFLLVPGINKFIESARARARQGHEAGGTAYTVPPPASPTGFV